ncbi:BNR/Asp-box repeat protein [Micromonospora kangleipakensis]|uniref:BNR/Asp-box repeat protein n=1 Tax=Micromonospora kangleipakensis TaxID=1077942 RepID=A0A4Q8BGI8_9ACTN|nr:exo-alpha-sialidase [Micromonospora kangleipakensis]RZU76339.1 BNR/Asp-box repeat protein [Micromonospora kangleipakensis]
MPGRSANRRIWAIGLVAVLVLTAAVLIGSRWRDRAGTDHHAATTTVSHVHGLAVNPADGQLYVATHHGVVRMSHNQASLVGDARQDTMGFAVVGPNTFLASGHPAPGQPGPAHLGLIESRDGGDSWHSLLLAGHADFHVLRTTGAITYGLDSTSGTLMASSDRTTWDSRSQIDAYDLAVDPKRADIILATTERGVQRSTDGGRTWQPSGGPPALLLHWQDAERLYAIGVDGRILLSSDGGDTWSPTGGTAPDAPVAFTVHGDQLFVATRSGDVRRSSDSGASWHALETSLS